MKKTSECLSRLGLFTRCLWSFCAFLHMSSVQKRWTNGDGATLKKAGELGQHNGLPGDNYSASMLDAGLRGSD